MKHKILVLFVMFNLIQSLSFAEVKEIKSYDDFPQSGVLAASGSLPGGNLSLPQLPMGMMGQPVPLLGSLSLSSDKHWIFSVNNNADKPLKVSFEIIQYDSMRRKISASKYSYKLKAGEKGEGKMAAASGCIGSVVHLTGWSWIK